LAFNSSYDLSQTCARDPNSLSTTDLTGLQKIFTKPRLTLSQEASKLQNGRFESSTRKESTRGTIPPTDPLEIQQLWHSVMAHTKQSVGNTCVDFTNKSFTKVCLDPRGIIFDHERKILLPRFPTTTIRADEGKIKDLASTFQEDRLGGYRGAGRDNLLNFISTIDGQRLGIYQRDQESKWVRQVGDKLIIVANAYHTRFPPVILSNTCNSKIPKPTADSSVSHSITSRARSQNKATSGSKHEMHRVIAKGPEPAPPFQDRRMANKVPTSEPGLGSNIEIPSDIEMELPKSFSDVAYHLNVKAFDTEMLRELRYYTPVSRCESTSPYLTVTFDDRPGSDEVNSDIFTQNKLAAHSSVALFNRFQLSQKALKMAGKKAENHNDTALRHFGITVDNKDKFRLFVFQPKLINGREWNGCIGTECGSGELWNPDHLMWLIDFIGYVQETFLKTHIKGIEEDFNLIQGVNLLQQQGTS
jgi:hypothetical protein